MAGQHYCFGDRSKADRISVVGKRALPLHLAYGKRGERGGTSSEGMSGLERCCRGVVRSPVETSGHSQGLLSDSDPGRQESQGQAGVCPRVCSSHSSESIIPTSCKHVPCVGCGRQGLAEPGLWFICTWRLCQRSTCHLGWLTGSDPRTTPRPAATMAGTPAPYGPELQAQVCD